MAGSTSASAARISRYFFHLTALLLAILVTFQVTSIRQESQTWDESTHLAAGLSYWKTGDYRMNPEHPPLVKLLCAMPLLFMNLQLFPGDPILWRDRIQIDFGATFLYRNRLPADTILFPARCVTIVLTALFGLSIALWTRSRFGAPAALVALTLFAFDPNITAHGRYVTTDLAVALFSFLACLCWGHALTRNTLGSFVIAGAALGLALGSKFSALFLIPAFVILALIRRPAWKYPAVAAATALLTLAVLYQGHLNVILPGLHDVMINYAGAREGYLFGKISRNGWWYYFPAAFALKSPVGLLTLTAIGACLALWKRPKPSFDALLLMVPAAIYFALCLYSKLDLGLRHLLPIYPMLYILVAVAVVRYAPRWLTVGCLAILIIESCSIYPNYLAFFNVLCGGPAQGPRYLLESNIDWGQDTKKLKAWLEARNIHDVCGIYFGLAMPAHYGIEGTLLPGNDETQARANLDCVAMASVTPLYGLYVPNDKYRWLREQTPVAKIGYSIYVYDLRKQQTPILSP